jgi:ferredoxin-NADP reductase
MTFLQTLARDVRFVLGTRPPPFAPRSALGRHHHVIANVAARTVGVRAITRETADAVTIELDASFDFRAGQFLTLIVNVEGTEHRRAYSICTAPHEGRVAVTVKRVGLVSGYLNDRLKVGDKLQILGPSGSFGDAQTDDYVLIGGGSGITPLLSIARDALRRKARVHLIYGNRSPKDAIFYDALEALKSEGLVVEHVFGERLDCELPKRDAHYFICGPEPMRVAVREKLEAMGVTDIHEERFTSPTQRKSRVSLTSQRVSINGREVTAAPGQTILEAGLAAGINMPFSCTMGGCGVCRVKHIDGDVEMEEPSCLTAKERQEGYVLACVARANGPSQVQVP